MGNDDLFSIRQAVKMIVHSASVRLTRTAAVASPSGRLVRMGTLNTKETDISSIPRPLSADLEPLNLR